MTNFDNRGRGSIWKNDRKEKDTHPDFTGSYMDLDGTEFWVSAWKRKEGAAAKAPALSFSMQRKNEDAKPVSNGRKAPADDMNDDIPF